MEGSVEAPIDLVWWAWTETERITEWFAPAANIVPVEGGAFELFFDPADHTHMSTIGCVITVIESKERLAFTWKGPDQFAQLMNEPVPATSVEVTFQKENGSTRVQIEHGGWEDGDNWNEAWEWHSKAWEGGPPEPSIRIGVRERSPLLPPMRARVQNLVQYRPRKRIIPPVFP